MGDRLARFGFSVTQGGAVQTVSPANVDVFIKEQIKRSFAFQEAKSSISKVDVASSGIGSGIRAGSFDPIFDLANAPRSGLAHDATTIATFRATQNSLSTAFSSSLKSRGIIDQGIGGAIGPIGPIQSVQPTQNAGAEQFNQQFFGQVFGTGNRILGTETIHELFKSEKDALGQVDFLFAKGGNALRNEVFGFTQDLANVHKKINDSKISGGPIGGVLKVATFGLNVSGLGAGLLAKTGVSKALGKIGLSSATQTALPGSAIGALKTTVGTIAQSVANAGIASIAKKFSQRPAGEAVGIRPGIETGSQKIANAQRPANTPTQTSSKRPSFSSVILSKRSVDRINRQRQAIGKDNLVGTGGSKPKARRRVLTRRPA